LLLLGYGRGVLGLVWWGGKEGCFREGRVDLSHGREGSFVFDSYSSSIDRV
jgi:hypothetical protein